MTRLELLEIAKPILFNTEMVKAIQDGRKTATRRPIKVNTAFPKALKPVENPVGLMTVGGIIRPQYQVDDYLYVRETWCKYSRLEDDLATPIAGTEKYYYRADGENPTPFNTFLVQKKGYDEYSDYPLWHPSIHMPKEAARIFLRVINIFPQLVKEITEEQAIAEGFTSKAEFISEFLKIYPSCTEDSWVWVIEFERVEVEE